MRQHQPLALHNPEGLSGRLLPFAWILIPTVISCLLIGSVASDWKLPQAWYNTYMNDQATAQLVLQAIASLLGFIQLSTLYRLFNHATRLRLQQTSSSLEQLLFWTSVSNRRIQWSVHKAKVLALVVFALFSALPAAVWAGAFTPIPTSSVELRDFEVPQFKNMAHVKEYPSEVKTDKPAPDLPSTKGYFTYAVGIKHLGGLLETASSATALGDQPRKHSKFDATGFSYVGRSFGVGGAVGLKDDTILGNDFALSYSYQEQGYRQSASCIHNSSTQFVIQDQQFSVVDISTHKATHVPLLAATGMLPNSNSSSWSQYFGFDTNSTVAIGVSFNPTDTRRYLAIASGINYQSLNTTQCELIFEPSVFNVSVDTVEHTISVVYDSPSPTDMDPSRNLTQVVARQFELIANDQTSIYTSIIGDSLNTSIATYAANKHNTSATYPFSNEDTLAGITNSVNAMADDMLVAYASAQLMIAGDMQTVPGIVTLKALRPGQNVYIYIMFVFNTLIVVLMGVEGIRTRGWRGLIRFDYLNAAHLVLATSSATTPGDDSRTEYGWKTHPIYAAAESEVQQLRAIQLQLQANSGVRLYVQLSKYGRTRSWKDASQSQDWILRRSHSQSRDRILPRSYTADSDLERRAPDPTGYELMQTNREGRFF